MFGFPPTTVREAGTAFGVRIAVSALVLFFIRDWFTSSGPGVPQSEAFYASAIAFALFVWCAIALGRWARLSLKAEDPEP